jgi:hypothetical protein
MNVNDVALHEQRRFLMVAFHPYGSDVCEMLQLPTPSLDVGEVERQAAQTPWATLFGGAGNINNRTVTTPQILGLAHLYERAAASLLYANHPNYHRSLAEDLISFFIALISLGGTSEHS